MDETYVILKFQMIITITGGKYFRIGKNKVKMSKDVRIKNHSFQSKVTFMISFLPYKGFYERAS
jgi:hypothetical protein